MHAQSQPVSHGVDLIEHTVQRLGFIAVDLQHRPEQFFMGLIKSFDFKNMRGDKSARLRRIPRP